MNVSLHVGITHLSFPRTLTPSLVPIFASYFSLFHWRYIFWLETSSKATDSWFVYQNIDLFSLYTFMLTSLCLIPPFFGAPLTDRCFLDTNLPVEAVVGSKMDKRELGQYASGDCCAELAVLAFMLGIYISLVPFQNDYFQLTKFYMMWKLYLGGPSVSFVSLSFWKKNRCPFSSLCAPWTQKNVLFSMCIWKMLVAVKGLLSSEEWHLPKCGKLTPLFIIHYRRSFRRSAHHRTMGVPMDFRENPVHER